MTRPELKRARAGFEKVRAILHSEWDPIGCGAPADEYDSYAWPVLALLRRQASRAEVEAYLRQAADQGMQCSAPDARLAGVLDRLMELDVS